MEKKAWKVSVWFARKGERDLLPEVYKDKTKADYAAYNINRNDPAMEARAEEVTVQE